jgi:membrane protease YdiL (CAAX protease family)
VQNEEFNNTAADAPLAGDLDRISPPTEIPTPDNPPWNSLIAFGVWFFSLVVMIFIPALFIIPYMLMNRQNSPESFQTDNTAILLNLLAVIPTHIVTLALAWFVVTWNGKFSYRETLGFGSGGFQWWYYPLILIAFFIVAGAVNYLIPEGDNELLRMLRSSRTAVYMVVVLATFTAPVVEEVVYRGILYSAFQKTFSVPWAVVIVTLLFAAVHFLQYWGSPGTILMICVLSLVLTLIRVKSKNLLPCIIMHTIFNGVQSLLLIAEPYFPKIETGVEEKAAAIIKLFT